MESCPEQDLRQNLGPLQFAIVLSANKQLHDDFLKEIAIEYGPERGGFEIIHERDIATCPHGKSYLVSAGAFQKTSMSVWRSKCNQRNPDSIILYVLNDTDKVWELSDQECRTFTFVISYHPDAYASMKDFVKSLR